MTFTLAEAPDGMSWEVVIDTAEDADETEPVVLTAGAEVALIAHSLRLLIAKETRVIDAR